MDRRDVTGFPRSCCYIVILLPTVIVLTRAGVFPLRPTPPVVYMILYVIQGDSPGTFTLVFASVGEFIQAVLIVGILKYR